MLRWMILGWVGMLTSGMAACAQQTAVAADEDAPVIRAMSPQEIARGLESHDPRSSGPRVTDRFAICTGAGLVCTTTHRPSIEWSSGAHSRHFRSGIA